MVHLIFYIVDVFAEEKYAGNQLAVVREAGNLSEPEMQKIAREMNYSETTFILSEAERDGGYDVRIFTPRQEVPFAGHPTLGTAYVIQREIVQQPVETITLNLKVGQIPVTFNYDQGQAGVLWMKQIAPAFGRTFQPGPVAQALSLDQSEIDDRFPIQEVSTGLPFIVAPLRTLEAVRRAQIVEAKFLALAEPAQAKAILIFCPETYHPQNQLNARVFAGLYGVPEDPATGSANGCLAGYLAKTRYFGAQGVEVRVEQGYEIGRPSLLYLKAEDREDEFDIFVGGRVVMVARGEFV